MAASIGVDMLEIERMERAMRRRPSILDRVFTDEERAYCDARPRPAEHYAARFAAREAVLKALGIGFGKGVGLKDVTVRNDEQGRPIAVLTGRAAQVAAEQGVQEVALSLSHTHDVAVANAVLVTADVRPKVEERRDPAAELLASFKSARTVIDELERLQRDALDSLGADEDEAATGNWEQQDGQGGGVPQQGVLFPPETNGA